MTVLMFRASVKDEKVAEVDAAAQAMFSAIDEAQPQGVRYASSKLPDGTTYVILLAVEDGVENPLPTVPAFRRFQEGLRDWVTEPAKPEPLTVVGSYRLF
jgi:hypothetical protein